MRSLALALLFACGGAPQTPVATPADDTPEESSEATRAGVLERVADALEREVGVAPELIAPLVVGETVFALYTYPVYDACVAAFEGDADAAHESCEADYLGEFDDPRGPAEVEDPDSETGWSPAPAFRDPPPPEEYLYCERYGLLRATAAEGAPVTVQRERFDLRPCFLDAESTLRREDLDGDGAPELDATLLLSGGYDRGDGVLTETSNIVRTIRREDLSEQVQLHVHHFERATLASERGVRVGRVRFEDVDEDGDPDALLEVAFVFESCEVDDQGWAEVREDYPEPTPEIEEVLLDTYGETGVDWCLEHPHPDCACTPGNRSDTTLFVYEAEEDRWREDGPY